MDVSLVVVISDTCVRIVRDVVEVSADGTRVSMIGGQDCDAVVFDMPDIESADDLAQRLVRAVVEDHPEHRSARNRVIVVSPHHVERIA